MEMHLKTLFEKSLFYDMSERKNKKDASFKLEASCIINEL